MEPPSRGDNGFEPVAENLRNRTVAGEDRSPTTGGWPTNGATSRSKRIVVSSTADNGAAADGSLVVRDLEAAFQSVRLENPQIEKLELRENGRLTLVPTSLDLTGRELTLVAGGG